MAKKADAAAAKQRQQKILLAVLGVALLAVLAFEGPKMLKKGSSSSATSSSAASATSSQDATTTSGSTATSSTATSSPAVTSTAPSSTGATVPAVATGPSATLAGVVVRSAGAPRAGTGQLWSLSRFTAKDPFVQQVKTESTPTSSSASGTTTGGTGGAATPTTPTTPTSPAGGTGGVVTPTTSTPPAVRTYATVLVNGQPQQLQLKLNALFPMHQPTFVLLAVAKNSIKVGVAGGKFVGGKAVELNLGDRVTLMNTATGQRFVMKLVYTGAAPEQIASFKPATPAASAQATSPSSP